MSLGFFEWYGDQLLKAAKAAVQTAERKAAEDVSKEAKQILMSEARRPTGHLAREIEVFESKYENGGFIVYAQGPGRWTKPYHAFFVEVGTEKMQPIPYLRPALRKNRHKRLSFWENIL